MELVEVNFRYKPPSLSNEIWRSLFEPNRNILNEAKELEEKWAKTGLLDSIQDKFKRQLCAIVLENQRLINERLINERLINERLINEKSI